MHRFNPEHHAKLDNAERLEWQNPTLLMGIIRLKPGETMVDIGSGTGFFAIPIAEAEPAARIIGADISQKMTDILAERAVDKGLDNLTAVTMDNFLLPFSDSFADIALVANVLHEFDEPIGSLAEVRRVLKPGGRLIIVDWDMKDTPVGPPMSERISEVDAAKAVGANGFSKVAKIEIYPYNYVLECS